MQSVVELIDAGMDFEGAPACRGFFVWPRAGVYFLSCMSKFLMAPSSHAGRVMLGEAMSAESNESPLLQLWERLQPRRSFTGKAIRG